MSVELISKFNTTQAMDGLRGSSISSAETNRTENEAGTQEKGAVTFGDFLKSAVNDANQTQLDADAAARELIAGRNKDIHGTMLALEKADISLRLLTQVRNKVIDAYREVMKMQI